MVGKQYEASIKDKDLTWPSDAGLQFADTDASDSSETEDLGDLISKG